MSEGVERDIGGTAERGEGRGERVRDVGGGKWKMS